MEVREKALREEILYGASIEVYAGMFDSMDSDSVIYLLREFHGSKSKKAGNRLTVLLECMLEQTVQDRINENKK